MKEKSKMNTGWHKLHPMPQHPTTDQRIEWHLQHSRHCQCRTDLPEKLKEEMVNRGIVVPRQTKKTYVASEIAVY